MNNKTLKEAAAYYIFFFDCISLITDFIYIASCYLVDLGSVFSCFSRTHVASLTVCLCFFLIFFMKGLRTRNFTLRSAFAVVQGAYCVLFPFSGSSFFFLNNSSLSNVFLNFREVESLLETEWNYAKKEFIQLFHFSVFVICFVL